MTSGASPVASPELAMQVLDERALDGSVSTAQYFRWRALAHQGLDGAAEVIEAVGALPRPESPTAPDAETPAAGGTAEASKEPRADIDETSRPNSGPSR